MVVAISEVLREGLTDEEATEVLGGAINAVIRVSENTCVPGEVLIKAALKSIPKKYRKGEAGKVKVKIWKGKPKK